jgi:nicotinamidase-related amidase
MKTRVPRKQDALLIIDMINSFAFKDGLRLCAASSAIVDTLLRLRAEFHRRSLPVIYVNDNFGHWDSDFNALVERTSASGSRGRDITRALRPTARDYFVLKPRHSAFYETPLSSLLEALKVKRLVLTGIASDSCVLYSATEAHTRGFDVWVPCNAVASLSAERDERSIAHVRDSLASQTAPV